MSWDGEMTSTYIIQDILQMTEYACNQSHKSLVTDLSYKIDILILKGAADGSILILHGISFKILPQKLKTGYQGILS